MSDDYCDRDIWGDLAAGEVALSFGEARALPCLQRGKQRPQLCTLYRWSDRGSKPAAGGERVTLETFQQSGRRCTTRSSVLRFLRALSGSSGTRGPSVAAATEAHRAAERRLAAAGI